jgi:hypothetical protein
MSSNILLCKHCNQQITFDNKHISQRTGKHIPLDIKTGERHDCPMQPNPYPYPYQSQQQRPQQQQQSRPQPDIYPEVLPHITPTQPQPQKQQQQQKERRYHQCNKGCGQLIYFDANNKSQSGKFIPLDKQTGLPHQCQQ